MVPRHGYLHLITNKIVSHLKDAAPACKAENVWFSAVFEQNCLKLHQPLKWYYFVVSYHDLTKKCIQCEGMYLLEHYMIFILDILGLICRGQ
jgi:hypothetical protein